MSMSSTSSGHAPSSRKWSGTLPSLKASTNSCLTAIHDALLPGAPGNSGAMFLFGRMFFSTRRQSDLTTLSASADSLAPHQVSFGCEKEVMPGTSRHSTMSILSVPRAGSTFCAASRSLYCATRGVYNVSCAGRRAAQAGRTTPPQPMMTSPAQVPSLAPASYDSYWSSFTRRTRLPGLQPSYP